MKNIFLFFVLIFLLFVDNVNSYLRDFNDQDRLYLKNKYEWYSDKIYYLVRKYCKTNPRIVFSLIHTESLGNQFAVSKYTYVYIFRGNKKVLERHRAIGLMQVMSFYYNENKLIDLETNIFFGCNILDKCFYKYKEFIRSVSCYNMGINNKKINYRYVYKILYNL